MKIGRPKLDNHRKRQNTQATKFNNEEMEQLDLACDYIGSNRSAFIRNAVMIYSFNIISKHNTDSKEKQSIPIPIGGMVKEAYSVPNIEEPESNTSIYRGKNQ